MKVRLLMILATIITAFSAPESEPFHTGRKPEGMIAKSAVETLADTQNYFEEVVGGAAASLEKAQAKAFEEARFAAIHSLADGEARKVADEMKDFRSGGAGRLYSPDLGINVGLNRSNMFKDSYSHVQHMVDLPDSALLMEYGFGSFLVGDHSNQGFDAIGGSVPDETVLYQVTAGRVTKYVCREIFDGHNVDAFYGIVDEDGTFVLNRLDDGLCLYTCKESWRNVTVTTYVHVGTVEL